MSTACRPGNLPGSPVTGSTERNPRSRCPGLVPRCVRNRHHMTVRKIVTRALSDTTSVLGRSPARPQRATAVTTRTMMMRSRTEEANSRHVLAGTSAKAGVLPAMGRTSSPAAVVRRQVNHVLRLVAYAGVNRVCVMRSLANGAMSSFWLTGFGGCWVLVLVGVVLGGCSRDGGSG